MDQDKLKPNWKLNFTPSLFKSRKEELIAEFVSEINLRRVGTKYKLVTPKEIALRINRNVFFKRRNDHLEVLLKHCIEKNSFSKFYWVCSLKNNPKN